MKEHYEIIFIITVKADERGQAAVVKKVYDCLTGEGGIITKQENWGNRKLSYDIKHERNGYYVLAEFDLESGQLNKIDKNLKLMPEILRFLIIKKKIKTEAVLAKEKMIQEKIAGKRVAAAEKEKREVFELVQKEEKLAAETGKPKPKETKISLDDLDKKLDEILKEEI